jgi:phosphoribosylaminoimidazole (AIR) synthetase
MGIGLVAVVAPDDADRVLAHLRGAGESGAAVIGEVVAGGEGVVYGRR